MAATGFFSPSYISAHGEGERTEGTVHEIEPPVMGWSSWNTYRVNINEELIRRQADAAVDLGLRDAGYIYINIDDGFFGGRDAEGNLVTHPERFPDGMKGIADYIHSKGMKAGIYSDAGCNTCGSIWDDDRNGIGVGLYGHERSDADMFFNKWGFDFIKIDYCGADNLKLEEYERYSAICTAIREVCDRKISLNICRWAFPGVWARDLARSWRISPDIRPEWESVRDIISRNLYLSAFAGEGHYNDMDMLEIGRGLSEEEEQTHFGMWCIMSSPLLIGCDLTSIPDRSLELLLNPELIALNQDPLGLQAYVVQHTGEGYVLVKDIEKRRGTVRAAALYNPSDSAIHFSVPLETLELGGRAAVRDLVHMTDLDPAAVLRRSRTDSGTGQSYSIEMDVPAHGVRILRIEADRRLEPVLYEAERALLPLFNDLGKGGRMICFIPYPGASGGMTVANAGARWENFIEWDDVYSTEGGDYMMEISYIPAAPGEYEINDQSLTVEVNGRKTSIDVIERDRAKGLCKVSIAVHLDPGCNTVRIGSPYTWAPDIDCFTLRPLPALP